MVTGLAASSPVTQPPPSTPPDIKLRSYTLYVNRTLYELVLYQCQYGTMPHTNVNESVNGRNVSSGAWAVMVLVKHLEGRQGYSFF